MGEARRRGSREERVAKAIERIDALRPEFIVCNGCAAELREVRDVAIEAAPGLDAIHLAHCDACDADTVAAQGTPEALKTFADTMRARTELGDLVGGSYTSKKSES